MKTITITIDDKYARSLCITAIKSEPDKLNIATAIVDLNKTSQMTIHDNGEYTANCIRNN